MPIYKKVLLYQKGEEWGKKKLICDLNLFITLAMNLLLPVWGFITVNKLAMSVELQYINSPKESC